MHKSLAGPGGLRQLDQQAAEALVGLLAALDRVQAANHLPMEAMTAKALGFEKLFEIAFVQTLSAMSKSAARECRPEPNGTGKD